MKKGMEEIYVQRRYGYKADIPLLKRALLSRLISIRALTDFEKESYVSHLIILNKDRGTNPCFTDRLTVVSPCLS